VDSEQGDRLIGPLEHSECVSDPDSWWRRNFSTSEASSRGIAARPMCSVTGSLPTPSTQTEARTRQRLEPIVRGPTLAEAPRATRGPLRALVLQSEER
jgi:hypothetical protein